MEHRKSLIRCTYIRALSNIMMIQISIMHTAVALDASTDSTDGMILTSAFIGEVRTGGDIIIIGTIHGSTDIIHRGTGMDGTHHIITDGTDGTVGGRHIITATPDRQVQQTILQEHGIRQADAIVVSQDIAVL